MKRDHEVIGVSQGALEKLDDAELVGVARHGISHLVNRDSPLQARLVAMLLGLSALIVVSGFGCLNLETNDRPFLLWIAGGPRHRRKRVPAPRRFLAIR